MSAIVSNLEAAWDPDRFAEMGHDLIRILTQHLRQSLEGRQPRVFPAHSPQAMLDRWSGDFRDQGDAEFQDLIRQVLGDSIQLQDPRYIGHQCCPPLPLSALCELVAALINNASAVYEMGPVNVAMERRLIQWMCKMVGFSEQADGVFTHGGSAGNLTALLAARQALAEFDTWGQGLYGGPSHAVLLSEQSHYSIRRALAIMGLGDQAAFPVPTDPKHRMTSGGLQAQFREARRRGRQVMAVVANACSTATGAYDDLDMVGRFCQDHGLWFHVDGAHGASVLLSPDLRSSMKGIHRANSLVWDAHKMLMIPALSTAVLFREGSDSFAAFRQHADYLFTAAEEDPWFDFAHRTLECTKSMMGLKLYVPLRVLGLSVFRDHVEKAHALARDFAQMIREQPDFCLAMEPQSNIVCFRHEPKTSWNHDDLQITIRKQVLKRGEYYIVQTRLDGKPWLRVTLIHPQTGRHTLQALLNHIREIATALGPESNLAHE